MKTRSIRLVALLVIQFTAVNINAQIKIADTIYFNANWQICEKPIAIYYRIGVLAALDNIWYYTGKMRDYTMENIPVLEAEYSPDGIREGDFRFYYPNGKLHASGKYNKGRLTGKWHLYYPDDKPKALIEFPESDEQQFRFIEFRDEQGNYTLQNGTGSFVWNTEPFESTQFGYVVRGEFNSGKRSGKWYFDKVGEKEQSMTGFTEKYNDKGKIVRRLSNTYSGTYNDTKSFFFKLTLQQLSNTEGMLFDDLFNMGDSTALTALIYYLIEQKPVEKSLRYKVFDTAFSTIMRTLDRYRNRINFTPYRDIDSKLEFKLGDKGYFENISFTGTGLEASEKIFYPFLFSKFKHMEMPGDSKVAIETNFTIYCYSIDIEEYVPANLSSLFTRQLLFSFMPREKMLKYLQENKKEIRRMNKERMNYYYYRRN